jgi:hypothetical protein
MSHLGKTFLGLAIAFAAGALFGQSFTGSISGLVTDPAGAVVVGAKVSVTDMDKNVTVSTLTNETGFYRVTQLQPGRYRIAVEHPGFRTRVQEGLPLSTQQHAALDIALEVGQVVEQVRVTAEAQVLETSTSSLSAIVENKRIQDLPLNGRNIMALTSLVPGVFQRRVTSGIDDTFYGHHFIVNGGHESTSDIILDGVSATVNHNIPTISAVSAIPSVESIQEFRIQTNAFSAEYGRSGGGIVTMVTKSGTNELHGTLFEFLRNSKMDANNFFSNRSNTPLASFKRNQFGGSAGGPLVIPKLYNGRDKTFFFVTYEGQRKRDARETTHTVPTALQKAGDFSETRTSTGALIAIYDPNSTVPNPASPGNFLRTPFAGNKIPAHMLNPVALNLQKYYPESNAVGRPFTNQQNFYMQAAYPEPQDRFETKIDHNISSQTRLIGRYTLMDSVYSKPNYWGNVADPGCCEPHYQRLQNAMLDFTRTYGSSAVLNLRYGLGRVSANRLPWSTTMDGAGAFDVTTLGFPASIAAVADQPMFPTVSIQDFTGLGPNGGDFYLMGDTTHSMIGSLSLVKGLHSLKFGVDFRLNYVNFGQLDVPVGSYGFFREFTQGPDPRAASAAAGVGYASFLLGFAGGGTRTAGRITHQIRPANFNHYSGFYVQDDFKVNSRLTLNLGFRWDFESGTTERYDRLTAIDPYIRNPLSDEVGLELKGGTLFGGSTLGRRAIRETDMRQLNPRAGFAFQLNSKTVIRSGYGIFFGVPPYGASRHYVGAAFQSETPMITTIDGVTPIGTTLSNPFPSGFNRFTGAANGLKTQVGFTIWDGWPDSLKPYYNQQWNFTIQHKLLSDMVWEIAYAGNKGTKLAYFLNSPELNQLHPSYMSLGNNLLTQVANPFHGIIPLGALSTPTVQRGQLLRPYPQYTGFQVKNAGWGNSSYHALQTRVEKRFSSGLSLLASYTFSKTMSDAQDGVWNGANHVRDWTCLSCERAVSSYDQPHRLVVNTTYELPFGRGKSFGAGWNRAADALLGGWQTNAIVTLAKGLPLRNPGLSSNTCFCFGGGQRPNSTGVNPNLGDAQTIDRWFDTRQLVAPAQFTRGTLGRTIHSVRTDTAKNIDFSLFKSFRPVERMTIQFRAEAFNLFNTPLFSGPNVTVGSALFGVVSSQENDPRQIQLGLKLLF